MPLNFYPLGRSLRLIPELELTAGVLIKNSSLKLVREARLKPELIAIVLAEPEKFSEKLKSASAFFTAIPEVQSSLVAYKEQAQKSITLQNAICTQIDTLVKYKAEQQKTNDLLERLRRALDVAERSRKSFVSAVLAEISKDVEQLYEKLHPLEELGKIRLSLDSRYIGSLHLHGDFHTEKDIAPQSVYSESHLDTLGLCVFFALAKKYRTDDTIVILDDVLTSVDSNHLDRFIDLLHDQEEHFNQIIITTHYRPWRDRYRNHRAPGGKLHFIELRSWSLHSGIRVQGMKLCLDELHDELDGGIFDRQSVASKAGIFLESMLEHLARQYRCKLSLSSSAGYALRELSDCFPGRLQKLLRVERDALTKDGSGNESTVIVKIELQPIIEKIKGLAAVRNQVGCHYNYEGSNVTDAEIEQLGRVAIELGGALVCAEGSDLPSRNRSGSYWESRSGKVRLYPLDQPN